jgi:hypothetical protein
MVQACSGRNLTFPVHIIRMVLIPLASGFLDQDADAMKVDAVTLVYAVLGPVASNVTLLLYSLPLKSETKFHTQTKQQIKVRFSLLQYFSFQI